MNSVAESEEQRILRSWRANAVPWSKAVRGHEIASRRLVTDRAVIESVADLNVRRIFDVGCGEGWLAHALTARGMAVVGVDAVPLLIEAACAGAGEFHVADYQTLAARRFALRGFDAAVCNFCLLGHESVEQLLRALPHYLVARGHLVLQTLHPLAACGEAPYRDGWRDGSWSGFSAEFTDPAPWYFRTLESWMSLLRRTGFEILECREPTLPGAKAPSSVLFIARAGA